MTRPSISVAPPSRLRRFRVGKQEAEPPGATPTDVVQSRSLAGMPVRLKVASSNDPSLRLYLRLGFTPIAEIPAYIELEWRG